MHEPAKVQEDIEKLKVTAETALQEAHNLKVYTCIYNVYIYGGGD